MSNLNAEQAIWYVIVNFSFLQTCLCIKSIALKKYMFITFYTSQKSLNVYTTEQR